MNRYVIEGAAMDAVTGSKVILCGRRDDVRRALAEVADLVKDHVQSRERTNGAEKVIMTSGGMVSGASSPDALGGRTADVVYLDPEIDRSALAQQWHEMASIATVSGPGEVIRG